MGWARRLFDPRDAWVRTVLLDVSGLFYLLLAGNDGRSVTGPQWALAITAFVLIVPLTRWPRVNLLVQLMLLGVAFLVLDDSTINQVGASWALAELVISAARPRVYWLGAGLLSAVHVALDVLPSAEPLRTRLFGLGVAISLPVLLGLAVRTSRELGAASAQRVVEEQRRRESESRAARADERSAIARELHDVVAHQVASMVLRVGVARHVLPSLDPRVAEVLDDVHGTGTAALADLRRLVAVLRDPEAVRGDAALTAIEPGALPAALDAAVENARRTGLTVEADVDEAAGHLDAVRGLAVLRLTQEALTNVAKHAGPTARVRLRVGVADGDVSWEVSDDGGGAPAPVAPPPGGGHGLTGMRERVEVLGGELTAGPADDGWRVATVLPAHSRAAA